MDTLIYESIGRLHALLQSRAISSVMLTEMYLKQIEKKEPSVGAFLHVSGALALEQAQKVDAMRISGKELGPLAGIPMALKDNLCTLDMPTTCASKMLEGYRSPYDAAVVEQLKNAGAVILGKLNMDEFAMGASTEHSYYKKTRNPVQLDRVPGGSSGGSAAAVAAFEAAYTLGSDTGGSIRQPASFCGVAGLKPTYGRVSRRGLVAFASSLDQIGPMGKRVEDLAYVLPVLTGHDRQDSTCVAQESLDAMTLLGEDVRKMRVAVPMNFLNEGVAADVRETVLASAERMKALGAQVAYIEIESMAYALPAYYILSSAEASSNLARFDGVQYGYRVDGAESLEALYKQSRGEGFGREVKRRIMLGTYVLSAGYYDAYYRKALAAQALIKKTFKDLFEKYDVVLTPVAPTTAYAFGVDHKNPVETYMGDIFTVPVNIAGLPALSVNAGYSKEALPIGIQLIGRAFDEKTILTLGHAFEQALLESEVAK